MHTARLHLRRFEPSDLDGLARVFAEPEVWEFPYGRAFTRDETSHFLDAQMAEWEECGFGCWIAVLEEALQPIGYVGLSVPMFLPEILPAVEVGCEAHRRRVSQSRHEGSTSYNRTFRSPKSRSSCRVHSPDSTDADSICRAGSEVIDQFESG